MDERQRERIQRGEAPSLEETETRTHKGTE